MQVCVYVWRGTWEGENRDGIPLALFSPSSFLPFAKSVVDCSALERDAPPPLRVTSWQGKCDLKVAKGIFWEETEMNENVGCGHQMTSSSPTTTKEESTKVLLKKTSTSTTDESTKTVSTKLLNRSESETDSEEVFYDAQESNSPKSR